MGGAGSGHGFPLLGRVVRSCGRGQSCRDAVCLSLAPRKVFWVRDTGAGEGAGVPRRLEGGGGGCGGPLGAAQVPIVELPEQLLVLHGEALVDLGLLLQRLLQDRLLCGKLPGRQKGARNTCSWIFRKSGIMQIKYLFLQVFCLLLLVLGYLPLQIMVHGHPLLETQGPRDA